jgi:hypothetical protein
MPSVGFELTISAGERPKNYALDRAATGTAVSSMYEGRFINNAHYFFTYTYILF